MNRLLGATPSDVEGHVADIKLFLSSRAAVAISKTLKDADATTFIDILDRVSPSLLCTQ